MEQQLHGMSEMAGKQWTGTFNPRAASVDDYLALYRTAI
jgi:hypothetical protein